MNNQQLHTAKPKAQLGAAILLTVVLLLIMVTLVTLYTGKIQTFEHRIALNTQNQKLAEAAANAGLQRAIAMLNVEQSWLGTEVDGIMDDNSEFLVNSAVEVLAGNRQLVQLSSAGISADGLAKATVSEQVLLYPILFNLPPAPLLATDGFSHLGEFELVSNPNGLGLAQPFSLWSNSLVNMHGTTQHTCSFSDFNGGDCSTNAISDHTIKQADIADGSENYPDDLVGYLFNTPTPDWLQVQQQADSVYSNCELLDINSLGVIWVNGYCQVSASTQIGTTSKPVIVIVLDSDVEFENDVVFYGLLFSFKPPTSVKTLDIHMQLDSAVYGAVVANFRPGMAGGLTRVIFDQNVIQRLQTNREFQRVARVAGSWHDF
jgi:hypothetical protein